MLEFLYRMWKSDTFYTILMIVVPVLEALNLYYKNKKK